VSGNGISWAICKSAPRSRQITMPAPHHSVFYRPDALLTAQPTASKHWRHSSCSFCCCKSWVTVCHPLARIEFTYAYSWQNKRYKRDTVHFEDFANLWQGFDMQTVTTCCLCSEKIMCCIVHRDSLQCFDIVGWVSGRACLVICLERGADFLHIVQQMPVPSQIPIISCII